jgi:lysophospholipase L1-like esterase
MSRQYTNLRYASISDQRQDTAPVSHDFTADVTGAGESLPPTSATGMRTYFAASNRQRINRQCVPTEVKLFTASQAASITQLRFCLGRLTGTYGSPAFKITATSQWFAGGELANLAVNTFCGLAWTWATGECQALVGDCIGFQIQAPAGTTWLVVAARSGQHSVMDKIAKLESLTPDAGDDRAYAWISGWIVRMSATATACDVMMVGDSIFEGAAPSGSMHDWRPYTALDVGTAALVGGNGYNWEDMAYSPSYQVAALTGLDCECIGEGGQRASWYLEGTRLADLVTQYNPRTVILEIGLNEFRVRALASAETAAAESLVTGDGSAFAEWWGWMEDIASACTDAERFAVCTMPPVWPAEAMPEPWETQAKLTAEIAAWNARIKAECAANGWGVIDLWTALGDPEANPPAYVAEYIDAGEYDSDGVHPNAVGRAAMHQAIADWLLSATSDTVDLAEDATITEDATFMEICGTGTVTPDGADVINCYIEAGITVDGDATNCIVAGTVTGSESHCVAAADAQLDEYGRPFSATAGGNCASGTGDAAATDADSLDLWGQPRFAAAEECIGPIRECEQVWPYVDNEVPDLAEWTEVVQEGAATVTQATDASFPDRGSYGLRCTGAAGAASYARKVTGQVLAAEGYAAMACWASWAEVGFPGGASTILRMSAGPAGNAAVELVINDAGELFLRAFEDDGSASESAPTACGLTDTGWHYLVVGVVRAASDVAADGGAYLTVNGHDRVDLTGLDNYDLLAAGLAGEAGWIVYGGAEDGDVIDLDEIRLLDDYPEPFSPEAPSDYACAERTLVLYREGSADSRSFAEYCRTAGGVPWCNLVPLPNCSADAQLANYAGEVVDQIVTDLNDWRLFYNTAAAAKCSIIVCGYGVPNTFLDGGQAWSIASLLARGGGPGAMYANPYYQATDRPTAAELLADGVRAVTAIDADTLARAKAIVDAGLAAPSGIDLSDSADPGWLMSDSPALLASLEAQHTRLAMSDERQDAVAIMVAADLDALAGELPAGIPESGATALLADTGTDAVATLRDSATWAPAAAITGGFAISIGFSQVPGAIDAAVLLDRLRQGWTLCEAFLAAVPYLDYTAMPVAWPLATVGFELGGYNLYSGPTEGQIDWDTPVAYARPGQASLALPFQPGQAAVLAVRAVSAAGVVEHGGLALAHVAIDAAGQLLPPPLAEPSSLTALPLPGAPGRSPAGPAEILVGFTCRTRDGMAAPSQFEVLSDHGTGELDLDTPVAVVSATAGRDEYQVVVSVASLPASFAVRGRDGALTTCPTGEVTVGTVPAEQFPAILQ